MDYKITLENKFAINYININKGKNAIFWAIFYVKTFLVFTDIVCWNMVGKYNLFSYIVVSFLRHNPLQKKGIFFSHFKAIATLLKCMSSVF